MKTLLHSILVAMVFSACTPVIPREDVTEIHKVTKVSSVQTGPHLKYAWVTTESHKAYRTYVVAITVDMDGKTKVKRKLLKKTNKAFRQTLWLCYRVPGFNAPQCFPAVYHGNDPKAPIDPNPLPVPPTCQAEAK